MEFVPLSAAHFAGVLFSVLLSAGIILFRKTLRREPFRTTVRHGLAALLVASELSLYGWYQLSDNWGIHALPFQLCTMTLWISAAMLIMQHKVLYEIAFFLGILGAMQALLTPNLSQTFPHFRYFHFFVAHAAIIAASVYMTAVEGFRPRFASVAKAYVGLHILAVPAAVVNSLTGSNFMFLARKPSTPSLLDLLAPWPWYLLQLEVVVIVLLLLLYGVILLIDKQT